MRTLTLITLYGFAGIMMALCIGPLLACCFAMEIIIEMEGEKQ